MGDESSAPEDAWSRRLAVGARGLVWWMGIGASLALAAWTLGVGEALPAYVRDNALPAEARKLLALTQLAGALAGAVVCLLACRRCRHEGLDAGLALAERTGRRFAPLVLSALVPILLHWRLWVGRDLTFMVAATLFACASLPLWRVSLAAGPVSPVALRERCAALFAPVLRLLRWPGLPLLIVVVGAVGYAVYFGYFTLQHHYALRTRSFDLGIEDNLMWNLIHGGPLFKATPLPEGPDGTHLPYHHTYLSFVLAPLYALAPRPQTLLVLQAAFIGLAALPLYLLAARRLPAWTAAALALGYLLYAPVHGANLYDFHYPPFMPFFFWFLLYFVERGAPWKALLFALLAISIREDVAGCVGLVGAYLILSGVRPRLGVVIMLLGLSHFIVVKMMVMPALLDGQSSFIHQYKDLVPEGVSGFGGVLLTVVGNPGYTLHTLVAEEQKLLYLLQIMTPLVFLPLLRPIGLLLALPGFFFTLLATQYKPMVEISFQYTFFWTTFLFIAVVVNLEWVRRPRHAADDEGPRRQRAWVLAIIGAMLLTSYQHGAVLQRNTARGGFRAIPLRVTPADEERRADLYGLIARVPPDAKVAASEVIVPHVSSRENAYTLRQGFFDAEYLLYETRAKGREKANLKKAMATGRYEVVEQRGDFTLARAQP